MKPCIAAPGSGGVDQPEAYASGRSCRGAFCEEGALPDSGLRESKLEPSEVCE